jgi:acyl carrier protein
MRSKQEIFGWVTEVLTREFEFAADDLRPATRLVDDLDLDSIDAVDMAVRLEEKTGFRFGEEELRSLETLQDVVDLIHERL